MFRKHTRTSMQCNIVLEHEEAGAVEVYTNDVSATGMFIRAPAEGDNGLIRRLSIGDVVMARLDSLDSVSEPLRLKVARVTGDGVGVIFV